MTPERRIVADSLGVGIATGAYGISFGAIATASGLSVAQACVLSLLVFTGASQFAFVGVLAAGGTPATGAVTAVALGSRNLFYGLAVAPLLKVRGAARLGAAHVLIDESTAMAVGREDERHARLAFYVTGFSIFALWNLMTLVGALAGTALGDPREYGLDAAVGAAFLGLLWPRLDSTRMRLLAVFGGVAALALVPVLSAGFPIILGGLAAIALGLLWGGRR